MMAVGIVSTWVTFLEYRIGMKDSRIWMGCIRTPHEVAGNEREDESAAPDTIVKQSVSCSQCPDIA